MSNQQKTIGIVLAAGAGRRFGGDKGLARLPDGMPMALRCAKNLSLAVDEVVCVVRPDDATLRSVFQSASFTTIDCHDAGKGMSASLHAGIESSFQARGWVIALSDMPLIREATYHHLEQAIQRATHQQIVQLEYQGRAGHPVWFPAHYRDDLLALTGDRGAKSLFQKYPEQVSRLGVEDSGVVQDFDTLDDFAECFGC